MPKPDPAEFRRDVVVVARRSEASVAQVAKDLGIFETYLWRWLKIADREDGLAGRLLAMVVGRQTGRLGGAEGAAPAQQAAGTGN